MKKISWMIMLMSTLGISCTDEKMPSLEQKHAKSKVFVNSYTTDTFYSTLKDRLISITENNLIVDALCQGWTDKADLESLKNADQSTMELSISSFNFFPDKTFMRNIRNDFQKGKWTYKDTEKELLLEYEDADMGKDRYKIRAIAPDELQLTNSGLNSVTRLSFVSGGKRYRKMEEDPFYYTNQLWRITPTRIETDEQLRHRVRDMIHFYVLFYQDIIAREQETVSFEGFPSCLYWYDDGIYMKKVKDLDEKWIQCFFNNAQATKAYHIIETAMDKKYKWPKENLNWVKKYLYALEQIRNNL